MDKIKRTFLWQGQKEGQVDNKPMSLINWQIMIMSKEHGGMGIRNLEVMNQLLMTKWM
jgi:hypothetical protein